MNSPRLLRPLGLAALAALFSTAMWAQGTPASPPAKSLPPGKSVVPDQGDAPALTPEDAAPAPEKKAEKAAPAAKRSKVDPKDEPKGDEKPVTRPPLRLQIDERPIDRDAPDRISYAPIVRKTAASVVYVYSSKTVKGRDLSQLFNDPNFRRFFEIPEHRGRGGRMPDRVEKGLGSGVVISPDGYIITNNHVVEGADEVQVSIGESVKRFSAKVIGRDALTDIAVLKIEPQGALVPATFGNSSQLQVGDVVLAIGNPFGIGQSVSRGIVSALSRGQLGIEELEDFIQTDAAINPGNSGGALIDSQGRVVGINTAILSATGSFNGVGLAIPINLVRFAAEQIVEKGRVDRGYLGVQTQEITEDIGAQFGAETGALVTEVTPDSPAEKAGVKPGDIILDVNGTDIRDRRHLQLVVTQIKPGTEVRVELLRENKRMNVTAKLGLRPTRFDGSSREESTGTDEGVLNGVTVGEITPELRDELQIPSRIRGAIVQAIDEDSPSGRQGLREGDVIMELDRRPVRNAEEAVKLSEEIKGPKVMVLIWRAGSTRFIVIDESK